MDDNSGIITHTYEYGVDDDLERIGRWIGYGSPTQPMTQQIPSFQIHDLCLKAAEAVRNEINSPIASGRVQTFGRVVCLLRKDK